PPTGEIVLISVNYRDLTCPLIIQPQSKSSDAQTVINLVIACAAGIGIILIRKLIGRSLQQRNIVLIEVQEILNEDYEEVDVIAMPTSTGTEVAVIEQENEYKFRVKVSVALTFVNTSETEEEVVGKSPRMPRAIKAEKCRRVVRWENYHIITKGFTPKGYGKKERISMWTYTVRTPVPKIFCGMSQIISRWASKTRAVYKFMT
ncbi:unnamed protein product, partial [Hymenolepis diminuta]